MKTEPSPGVACGSDEDGLLQFHQRSNHTTHDRWDVYADHRARMMKLIRDLIPEGSRTIALIGAGNANDVDLTAPPFPVLDVTLVDPDGQALRSAAARHSSARFKTQVGTLEQIVESHAMAPQDVVVSCCVLSQVSAAARRLGGNPRDAVLQHLKATVSASRSRCVLVTDFCLMAEDVDPVPESPAAGILRMLGASRRHEGLEPEKVVNLIQESMDSHRRFGEPIIHDFWTWRIGRRKRYGVVSMYMDRQR